MTAPTPPASPAVEAEALTPAQLDAVISAMGFVLAGDWDSSSHDHTPAVYERALDKLQALQGRIVKAATKHSQAVSAEMREAAIGAGARAMCDRVNGVGDYDENIDQRRAGWVSQARAGVAAYLTAIEAFNNDCPCAVCVEALAALAAPPTPRGEEERLAMAKRLFWADAKHGDAEGRIPDEWRDKWWSDSAAMPLSGDPFASRWLALADAALSTHEARELKTLIVVTDDKGFVTLHEPNEDGEAGDLVASVWRDDWLPAFAAGTPAPVVGDVSHAAKLCDQQASILSLARGHDDAEGKEDRWYQGGIDASRALAKEIRALAATPASVTPDAGDLRCALGAIRDGDVPRPVGKQWRGDAKPSKNDKCIHDVWMYEDCSSCTADFITATLTAASHAEIGEGEA